MSSTPKELTNLNLPLSPTRQCSRMSGTVFHYMDNFCQFFLPICELFPNERLPGRKFKYRWLFQKFRRDWEKCTRTNEKQFAEKFDVSVTTIYNWSKKIRAQKRQSLIQQLTKGVSK